MPRVFDMARIRKREEAKQAAQSRTDFPGADERESVLLGVADEWPDPDLSEAVEIGGRLRTVGSLSASECTGAVGELGKTITALGKKLRVSMRDWVPETPLRAEDYTPANRGLARQLNGLVLTLRAVRRQRDIQDAAIAVHARKERDATLLAKQRLIDEAPAALERVNKSLEGLSDAVALVDEFVQAVRLVSSAPELISFAQRLRETAEKAGARNLPPVPTLNGHDPVVAMRLAKVAGILPIVVRESDQQMANDGRAAVMREEG